MSKYFEKVDKIPCEFEEVDLCIHSKTPLYANQESRGGVYFLSEQLVEDIFEGISEEDEEGKKELELERKTIRKWRVKLENYEIQGGFLFPKHKQSIGILEHPVSKKQYWGVSATNCARLDIFKEFEELEEWIKDHFDNDAGCSCESCNERHYKQLFPKSSKSYADFAEKLKLLPAKLLADSVFSSSDEEIQESLIFHPSDRADDVPEEYYEQLMKDLFDEET